MKEIIWADAYPELVNKIRWAISTSLKTPSTNYPFSVSQLMATILAQDVIEWAKAGEDQPGILASTTSLRKHYQEGVTAKG